MNAIPCATLTAGDDIHWWRPFLNVDLDDGFGSQYLKWIDRRHSKLYLIIYWRQRSRLSLLKIAGRGQRRYSFSCHFVFCSPDEYSSVITPVSSPLHSFTLNSKLTFLVNLFRHRSLTIDTSDWLPRLLGPFSVFTVFVGVFSMFLVR